MSRKSRPRRHQLPNIRRDPISSACGVVIVSFGTPIPEGTICHYCWEREATTRDHIVPKASLGADAWWNLVPACKSCNKNKGDKETSCHCAFCNRAGLLHGLGHTRMIKTLRWISPYRGPQETVVSSET